MTDADLIEQAVQASGQSPRCFAIYVLGRDKRTVERWRAGAPIPPAARAWLECWLSLTARHQDLIVRLLVPDDERQAA